MTSTGIPIELSPESVDAVAAAVVERLREESIGTVAITDKPLTTAEVARLAGRSHEWVRGHRQELGLIEVDGDKPRLLFDPVRVKEFMSAGSSSLRSQGSANAAPERKPGRPRGSSKRQSSDLLPIKGRS